MIKTPLDLFHADAPEFKWASNAADIHIGKDNPIEKTRDFSVPLKEWTNPSRDPIVIFGTRVHQRMKLRKIEGAMTKWSPFGAMEMLRFSIINDLHSTIHSFSSCMKILFHIPKINIDT